MLYLVGYFGNRHSSNESTKLCRECHKGTIVGLFQLAADSYGFVCLHWYKKPSAIKINARQQVEMASASSTKTTPLVYSTSKMYMLDNDVHKCNMFQNTEIPPVSQLLNNFSQLFLNQFYDFSLKKEVWN